MPSYLAFVFAALLLVGFILWSLLGQRRKRRVQELQLERLGFRPCPEEKDRLQETVTHLENNHAYRYQVREPRRLEGQPGVYYYVKIRLGDSRENAVTEEEFLFPLKRPSRAGLVLVVKPSSMPTGLASRLVGTVATASWDAQPDDLRRLELPPDLEGTNVVGALGPPGTNLWNLIDASTLSVAQGLGDAGCTLVRFRDAWCSVSSVSARLPLRLEELIARLRPLL